MILLVHFSNRSHCEYNFSPYAVFSIFLKFHLLTSCTKNYQRAWGPWPSILACTSDTDTILQVDGIAKEK